MKNQTKIGDRAIVIGGSIAGLLSGRVLSDFFAEVIILDKDTLPSHPIARKGVPQSSQPHVLLTKGYRIISELFPNIEQELEKQGALPIDWGREFYTFGEAGWWANTSESSGIASVTCSRPLLEWTIRKKLAENPQIQFLTATRVTGLIYEKTNQQITGVRINSQGDRKTQQLLADLTIDCSGRNSKASKWLQDIGLTSPPETIINGNLGYATRRYKEPKNFSEKWKVLLINQAPPEGTKLGYLARIEGGEWIATLGGYEKDFPPIDDKGFLEFARDLRHPKFYETIKDAEPVSPLYAYRATANRLRHYEKIDLPSGFIALGDAVCALCPVYGQGMTVSALAAIVLQQWLKKTQQSWFPKKLNSSAFQKKLAKSNDFHWNTATAQDSRFLKTINRLKPNFVANLFQGYLERLQAQATLNPQVYVEFLKIAHSLKSPSAFFSPRLLWQVWQSNLTQK